MASIVPCNLTASILGNSYICTGGTQLTATGSASNLRFNWNTGSTATTILINDTLLYSVTVTDLDSGCSAVANKQIYALPQITITPLTSDHCLYNDTTILTAIITPIEIMDELQLKWNVNYSKWYPAQTNIPPGVSYLGDSTIQLTILNGTTNNSPWLYNLEARTNCFEDNIFYSNDVVLNFVECTSNQCDALITPEVVTCPISPVTFVATPGTTGTTYLWSTGQTTQSIVIDTIPNQTTTYSVTVTCPDQTVSVRESHIVIVGDCSSKNPEAACAYTPVFYGYKLPNNILKLTFNPGNFIEFLESMYYNNVEYVYVDISGQNSGNNASTRSAMLYNRNTDNQLTWSHNFLNFGNYDSYTISLRVFDILGNEIICSEESELVFETSEQFPYCLLMGGLKYEETDQNTLTFSFDDPNNPNHFTEYLASVGIDEIELNDYLNTKVSHIRFKLTSLIDGVPFVKEEVHSLVYNGNFQMRNLEKAISNLPLSIHFSGNLKMLFTLRNNLGDTSCDSIDINFGDIPELPFVQCGEDMTDESDLTISEYNGSIVGEIFSINKLPLIILQVTQGNPNTGLYGQGHISLPFFGIGGVLVNLNGIKINRFKQVYSGSATAIQGPNQVNLNFPPILAGSICLPPPPDPSVYVNGINPNTGLDKYGFNPITGIHAITKNKYDLNGFDINGIHKDTGQPQNSSGCTRDGIIYNEDQNAPKVPCDPSEGVPPGLGVFLDSLYNTNFDALVIQIIDSLILEKSANNQNCDSIRNLFNPSIIGTNPEHVFGQNNILLDDNMHLQFNEKPYSIPSYVGERNAQMITFENNHIALYDCTKANFTKNQWVQRLQNLKEDPLFTELIEWLQNELSSINSNELNFVKNPNNLKSWLAYNVNLYLSENKDISFHQNSKLNLDNYDDVLDVQTASNDDFIFFKKQNLTYQRKFNLDIETAVDQLLMNNSTLNGVSSTIPIVKKIDKGNFKSEFIFTNFRFYPTNSDADIYVVVENKDNGKKLIFRGLNINFNGGGVDSLPSRLSLVNDVEVKLTNNAKLKVHKGNAKTYLQWNCDGIQRINLSTTIEFCSNYVVGLENDMKTVAKDSILQFDVELGFEKWLEFTVRVKGKPFYIKNYPDYPISIDTLIIDYSGTTSYNMTPPLGYTNHFFNETTNTFENLWKGFYLKGAKVVLQSSLFSKSDSTEVSMNALNCLFDDTGFSGMFELTNLISFSSGILGGKDSTSDSRGGWQFSLNRFNIVFLHNSLAGGGLGGEILVPKLENPFIYRGTIVNNKVICLKLENVHSNNKMPSLRAISVTLEKNTYIQGIYDIEKKNWDLIANLCGSLSVASDTGFLSKFQIPRINFQNFRIQNQDPVFNAGYWGMGDLDGAISFNFKGFGMSLDSIRPYSSPVSQDTMYLGIFFGIQIADSLIVAHGGFDIISSCYVEDKLQKFKYEGLRLRHICVDASYKELFSLVGCVEFFYDNQTFGDGWRGMVNLKLKIFKDTKIGMESVVIFGNKAEHEYWSVDLIATGSPLFTAMGINFTGIGGGLAKGMYPDYTFVPNVVKEWDIKTFLSSPIGTTITGVVYTPNPQAGYEIKLITRFEIVNKDVGHGTGEIIVRLNSEGGLDEIEIRAQASMIEKNPQINFPFKSAITTVLDDVSNINVGKLNVGEVLGNVTIPDSLAGMEAVIKGIASFKMNFQTKIFKGTIAAFLTTGKSPGQKGPLSGIGPRGELCFIDIYFGPGKWYIYAGEPAEDKRMGAQLKIGSFIDIKLSAYLCIGSVIPDFPPLPKEVSHLGRGLGVPAHVRSSGRGFVLGAALKMSIYANAVVASANIDMGAGFDVMMRKFNEIGCIQDNGSVEPLGVNGYYSMGQLWAYLKGDIKVFGISIFKAGFATALQFQAPNPTWIGGAIELQVYNIDVSVKLDAGDKCRYTSGDPADLLGIEVIESLEPIDNIEKISGCENLIINLAIKDGSKEKIDFGDGNGLTEVTVKINWDSTGVFYKGYKLDCLVKKSDKKITFIPQNFYPSLDSILFYAKIDIILPSGNVFASQRKYITYYTEELIQYIPTNNVEYSYPTSGMVNFYKNEYKQNIGFIKLISGQGYIFNSDQPIVAKFTNPSGISFTDYVSYNSLKKTIEFKMSENKFQNGEYYRMEIIRSDFSANFNNSGSKPSPGPTNDSDPIYTLYFRVSDYNTLAEKIAAMNALFNVRGQTDPGVRSVEELHFQKFENTLSEKFSNEELFSKILTFAPITGAPQNTQSLEYNLFFNYINGNCCTNDTLTCYEKSYGPYALKTSGMTTYVTTPIAQSVNEEVFANRSIDFNYDQVWFDATGHAYNNNINVMKQDHLDFKDFCYENQIVHLGNLEEYYIKESLQFEKMIRTGPLEGSKIRIEYRLPNGTLTTNNNNLPSYYFKAVNDYEPEPLPTNNPNQPYSQN